MLIYALLLSFLSMAVGQNFSQVLKIYDILDKNGRHFTDVRPVMNQNGVVTVYVGFCMLNILEVAELSQTVTYNVYFHFTWIDEITTWNTSHYGGVSVITVGATDIWKPELVVMNSVGERELYKNDNSPLQVEHTGQVSWMPGGPIATSCRLDLSKYPVDEHHCYIKLTTMNFQAQTVKLTEELNQNSIELYTENTEWEFKPIKMSQFSYQVDGFNCTGLQINVYLRRRPISLLLGYIIPVTFISFLNLFVFLIPAESGEKVNAGITVLLSQAMYLSTMSSMLPRSTNPLPVVTYYLFLLIINSTMIVFLCIIVVALQNWEENRSQAKADKRTNRGREMSYVSEENLHLRVDMSNLTKESPQRFFAGTPDPCELSQHSGSRQCDGCENLVRSRFAKCPPLSKCINMIAFILLFGVWLCGTFTLIKIVKE